MRKKAFKCENANDCSSDPHHLLPQIIASGDLAELNPGSLVATARASSLVKVFLLIPTSPACHHKLSSDHYLPR